MQKSLFAIKEGRIYKKSILGAFNKLLNELIKAPIINKKKILFKIKYGCLSKVASYKLKVAKCK
jgi:hypothetical protein